MFSLGEVVVDPSDRPDNNDPDVEPSKSFHVELAAIGSLAAADCSDRGAFDGRRFHR